MPMSTSVKKIRKKITIKVIQHDASLCYLRPFYDGAFSIVPKHDFDDQFFLLTTVLWRPKNFSRHYLDIHL
jgi:hypothetical protein